MSVRNYVEEDLDRILHLYGSSTMGPLFFARDRDFLKYLTIHPGVQPEGVFVCENNEEIDGLAIVAIDERDGFRRGKVIELCTASDSAAGMLSQRAFDYCCTKGADIVYIKPPKTRYADNVFSQWMKVDEGIMLAKPLFLTSLVETLVARENVVKRSFPKKKLLLVLEEEIIEVNTTVEPASVNKLDDMPPYSDILVKMSAGTLLEIIFRASNPYIAYLRGRIRIQGVRSIPKALRFLSAIQVGVPYDAMIDAI